MKNEELKKIWSTLATEQLIDKKLAKENILEIITQQGNGVIGKLQKKLRLDFNVYLSILVLIPFMILFLAYRDSQGLLPAKSSGLGGPYLIPGLMAAFLVYALMSLKRSMEFVKRTYNTGTLKDSLTNVKSYFDTISKKGYWIGTVSLMAILTVVAADILVKIGGLSNFNFSWGEANIFESYLFVLLVVLIIAIPFIVRLDARKYAGVLNDLNQTIEELNREE